MDSLNTYKANAEQFKPIPPLKEASQEVDALLSFDGKDYVSAMRAAKLTGYHQDYVGQLAREGTVLARQVGNRWFVERESIAAHKTEKDALLAAVQVQAVGLRGREIDPEPQDVPVEPTAEDQHFTYSSDAGDLMPRVPASDRETESIPVAIPIRVIQTKKLHHEASVKPVKSRSRTHGKTIFFGTIGAAALTVAILVSVSISNISGSSQYASGITSVSKQVGDGISGVVKQLGDTLEALLVRELIFKRFN